MPNNKPNDADVKAFMVYSSTNPRPILSTLHIKDIEKFCSKVTRKEGCWGWLGKQDPSGYSYFNARNHGYRAHRVSYALFNGKEPGPVLDHLCRNRACINPGHLEEVTTRENVLRGESITAKNARLTHCVNGHDLANSYVYHKKDFTQRVCKQCSKDRDKATKKAKLLKKGRVPRSDNTSGTTGIYWHKNNRYWYALINVDGKRVYLGASADKDKALAMRKAAENEYKRIGERLWTKV